MHKPVCNLCLIIVCTTTSEKSDKLHIEKREEFLHEHQRLFTFCDTVDADAYPPGSIDLS